MLYKQPWKEWLDAAKHIWAHLVWIAHREAELMGDSVSVSQTVAMFGALSLSCCLIMLKVYVLDLARLFGEIDHLLERLLAKTNKSTGSSKYGHNSHSEKFSSLYEQFTL